MDKIIVIAFLNYLFGLLIGYLMWGRKLKRKAITREDIVTDDALKAVKELHKALVNLDYYLNKKRNERGKI